MQTQSDRRTRRPFRRTDSGRSHQIAVIAGTRPEIIKLAPLICALEGRFGERSTMVVDTGQHYDHAMSGQFWEQLGLRPPEERLSGGGLSRSGCVGYLTVALGDVLATRHPDAVVVQGDTNSTLAGALAANAVGVPLIHVEAGLRSRDRAMPEEHNRIVVDQLADLCCAATRANVANLVAEGIADERIALTGNTIVEGINGQLPARPARVAALARFGLVPDRYVLATIHRPENTDDSATLRQILEALSGLVERVPVLVALHPRTRDAIARVGAASLLSRLIVTGPLDAGTFLSLAAHAAVIVSDSGGLAEEVTVLKRPLVIVRHSTERAESIRAGFAILVRPDQIEQAAASALESGDALLGRLSVTPSPYGDGSASKRIAALTEVLITAGNSSRV